LIDLLLLITWFVDLQVNELVCEFVCNWDVGDCDGGGVN
jgi:hypothetical protein